MFANKTGLNGAKQFYEACDLFSRLRSARGPGVPYASYLNQNMVWPCRDVGVTRLTPSVGQGNRHQVFGHEGPADALEEGMTSINTRGSGWVTPSLGDGCMQFETGTTWPAAAHHGAG